MPNVISTAGATEITHEGTTYTADHHGVFDLPEHVVAEIGRLNDLVDSAAHSAKLEAERIAEECKPENLHARLVDLENILTGIDAHLAAKVEESVAKIDAAVKAMIAKGAPKTKPAKTDPPPAS